MLKIQNLKSGYQGMEVLHGIDFEVKTAEIVAIIGPNGAGKSTLLKSIFNLAEIYSGKIIFKNKDITKLLTHQLIRQAISFVPQGRQVFANLTVTENLEMGAYALDLTPKIRNLRLEKIYRFFPVLKEKEEELAASLSGGQQQMLSIARALIQGPELLLLDEPSLGLDPKAMKQIFQKISAINQDGAAVVIVEQNARQAVKISQRVYVLEDGRIALQGGKEILTDPRIKNIYFGGR